MRPELMHKLEEFVKSGLIVYGPRPQKSPGLKDYPACDDTVRKIASRIWGNIDEKNVLSNNYGKGKMFYGLSLANFFSQNGLTVDVDMPADFVFTHRKEADTDIYFIANQKEQPRTTEISFRITGKQPELWDALTGEQRILNQFAVKDGRTIIPLEFSQVGGYFIIFRRKAQPSEANRKNFPVFTETQAISGKWNVTFSSSVNPPFNITLEQLTDWTTSNMNEIKYFCGKATYATNFNFGGKLPGTWFINLGKVESLAKIRLNGKEINTLWCYPYRVNVSNELVKGENKLEIDIVNQWWNQLIGDAQPGAVRKTNVSARFFWKADDTLVPSGLMGPVVLETIK